MQRLPHMRVRQRELVHDAPPVLQCESARKLGPVLLPHIRAVVVVLTHVAVLSGRVRRLGEVYEMRYGGGGIVVKAGLDGCEDGRQVGYEGGGGLGACVVGTLVC